MSLDFILPKYSKQSGGECGQPVRETQPKALPLGQLAVTCMHGDVRDAGSLHAAGASREGDGHFTHKKVRGH